MYYSASWLQMEGESKWTSSEKLKTPMMRSSELLLLLRLMGASALSLHIEYRLYDTYRCARHQLVGVVESPKLGNSYAPDYVIDSSLKFTAFI